MHRAVLIAIGVALAGPAFAQDARSWAEAQGLEVTEVKPFQDLKPRTMEKFLSELEKQLAPAHKVEFRIDKKSFGDKFEAFAQTQLAWNRRFFEARRRTSRFIAW